ncbi:MAG: hypothetical protein AAFZ52_12805, partial [Bacteroidota bacterium]
ISVVYVLRSPAAVRFAPEQLTDYGFTDGRTPAQTVDHKIGLVSDLTVPTHRAADFQLLLDQLRLLDQLYEPELTALSKGTPTAVQQQRVLNYYRTKADVLDHLLLQVEKTLTHADENDTTVPLEM